MLHLFSFVFNSETHEATMAGNISAPEALGVLQQLVIAQGIQQAKKQEDTPKKEKDDG